MLRERLYRGLLSATVILGLSGCAGTAVTPMDVDHTVPEPDSGARAAFAYPPGPVNPVSLEEPSRMGRYYFQQRLAFDVPAVRERAPLSLKATYYRGTGSGKRPLIIVVPVWGQSLYRWPSVMFSRYVRRASEGKIDILEIDGTGEPLINWESLSSAPTEQAFLERSQRMVDDIMQAVAGIRRMVDWAGSRKEIDHETVAVVGFSMGSIVASMALGSDDRFRAGSLVMGAAELSTVFASCQGRTGGVREAITERFDWSTERYKRVFDRVFRKGEPSRLHGFYRPADVLMIDSMYDDCMPQETRDALWETLGRPRRITFIAGHRMAFLAMTPIGFNYGHRIIYDFIAARLRGDDTRTTDHHEK